MIIVPVDSVLVGDIDASGRVICQVPQPTHSPYPNSSSSEWYVYYVEEDNEPKYQIANNGHILEKHFPLNSRKPKTLAAEDLAYIQKQVRTHPISEGNFKSEMIDSGLFRQIMIWLNHYSGKTIKESLNDKLACHGPY